MRIYATMNEDEWDRMLTKAQNDLKIENLFSTIGHTQTGENSIPYTLFTLFSIPHIDISINEVCYGESSFTYYGGGTGVTL